MHSRTPHRELSACKLRCMVGALLCRAMAFVPVTVDPAAPNAGLRLQHALAHAKEARLLQCAIEVAKTLCTLQPD